MSVLSLEREKYNCSTFRSSRGCDELAPPFHRPPALFLSLRFVCLVCLSFQFTMSLLAMTAMVSVQSNVVLLGPPLRLSFLCWCILRGARDSARGEERSRSSQKRKRWLYIQTFESYAVNGTDIEWGVRRKRFTS